jgi:FkbM family methyltransferase
MLNPVLAVARRAMRAAVRLPLRLMPPSATVRIWRGPLKGLRWVTGAAPHGAWLGRLEGEVLADFARHVPPHGVVWDIGANVGLYALAAAQAAGRRGLVVAFEPVPENLSFLRRHLELNALAQVTVVPVAVSDAEGVVRMSRGATRSEFHLDVDGTLEVPSLTLDAWHGRQHPPRQPDVIKIDVEGAEVEVLRGAQRILTAYRPRVYLAIHGDEQAEGCRALLVRHGYTLTTVRGERWPFQASEWIAIP